MEPKFGIYLSAWIALSRCDCESRGLPLAEGERSGRICTSGKASSDDDQTANGRANVDRIDRWGKVLTITALVYGCAILAAYLWMALNQVNR